MTANQRPTAVNEGNWESLQQQGFVHAGNYPWPLSRAEDKEAVALLVDKWGRDNVLFGYATHLFTKCPDRNTTATLFGVYVRKVQP